MLASFLLLWQKLESSRKKDLNCENAFTQLDSRQVCLYDIFFSMTDVRGPHLL